MAKVEKGRGAALERSYRVAALLLAGETLDRKRIARELGISEANAYRHILAIKRALPVEPVTAKAGLTRVRIARSLRKNTPAPTVVAACFGASLSRLFQDTPFEERLRDLVGQVIEGVKDDPRYQNHERQFLFIPRGGERALRRHGTKILDKVLDAILERRLLRLTYQRFEGASETVQLQPWALAVHEHQLYLLGRAESGVKNVRFSRITAALPKKETFEYPTLDDFDPRDLFRHSLGIFIHNDETKQISVEDVKLRLSKRWASYVETHRWHETQRHKVDEHGVVLDLHVRTCPELDQLILGFGEDAEVLEPAWLRERISRRVDGMAARYETKSARAQRPRRTKG